jgi:Domain of unknown function (DUF4350)
MRRYIAGVVTIVLVIAILVGMSAAGAIEFDRPVENEFAPNRSTYNSGQTGTRALYQLLEESGTPVARWRSHYSSLYTEGKDSILVIIGPFPSGQKISEEEAIVLQSWISTGGRALIISRSPIEQFGDPAVRAKEPEKLHAQDATPEQFIDQESDRLIAQPTELTRKVRGLAFSNFSSRMSFHNRVDGAGRTAKAAPPDDTGEEKEEYSAPALYAPVIHLGDKDGAALADFTYGEGRIIFLSDPFVVANNGIARGGNLTLAMNMLRSMGSPDRRIFFDEFHHGYYEGGNPLVNYFRGTPAPWLLLQGLGLSLLIVYTYSRRFARPLPLPQVPRHSPLEFVGSMANLQQAAQARELALENIYPRFKAGLCRRLGLSSRASRDEIVAGARRRRLAISEIELRQTLSDAEMTLAGEPIDDARLLALVSRMRRIISQIETPRA